ncbi:hypothetical protein PR048_027837 [Dryococelus australis]|uniref:Uncharacterized protein n=1 Tax=Dryococelus australis TaxID=614101 RepID=A0ABQ9GHK8_9NEOP|nr:hypothetical protein PR048_027837 [Dryococelus australis]
MGRVIEGRRVGAEYLVTDTPRRRTGQAPSRRAFRQCEPGSIPGRVTPGSLHVGIVTDDAAGMRVFSGVSRFPRPFIPVLLHTHLNHPHRLSGPRCLRAAQISSLAHSLLQDWKCASTATGTAKCRHGLRGMERGSSVVRPRYRIREDQGSIPGPAILNLVFHSFPKSLQANARMATSLQRLATISENCCGVDLSIQRGGSRSNGCVYRSHFRAISSRLAAYTRVLSVIESAGDEVGIMEIRDAALALAAAAVCLTGGTHRTSLTLPANLTKTIPQPGLGPQGRSLGYKTCSAQHRSNITFLYNMQAIGYSGRGRVEVAACPALELRRSVFEIRFFFWRSYYTCHLYVYLRQDIIPQTRTG